MSVTGLTVVSTADTFSTTGIVILAFVLQFGGIGIMTLGTFIWLIMGKRIGLKERKLIMVDQNQTQFSGIVNLMKQVLFLILWIEFLEGLYSERTSLLITILFRKHIYTAFSPA